MDDFSSWRSRGLLRGERSIRLLAICVSDTVCVCANTILPLLHNFGLPFWQAVVILYRCGERDGLCLDNLFDLGVVGLNFGLCLASSLL
jgi:hypothetical protein